MPSEPKRPDPEAILREIQAQERRARCGILKIFLGYAAGVGKSFQMIDEGRRRAERGEDVVIAALQPEYDARCAELVTKLKIIPTLRRDGREVIDVEVVLRRRPGVVIVDGLAYDNPPGSRHEKRWQDINELLEAGVSVITSLNLHHIEELRDKMALLTGRRVSETVPLSFLEHADEVVVVDAPPAGSLTGEDGAPLQGHALMEARAGLAILREKALLVAAEIVDDQLRLYLQRYGAHEMWNIEERILVCISAAPHVVSMIESGRRNADRFRGEFHVVTVRGRRRLSDADQAALESHLALARSLGAKVEVLDGSDVADAVVRYAREHGITQIFVGQSARSRSWLPFRQDPTEKILHMADGIDVSVFPIPEAAK